MKTIITLILLSLFSLNTFAQDYTQWGLPEGAKMRLGKEGLSGNIAYSPDGTRLAVASVFGFGIRLYDTATYQEVALLTGHTAQVESVAFSPDGRTLASASYGYEGEVRLWDAHTGEHKQTLRGHTAQVYSVAFSPDGRTLASASGDNTVRLWDVLTGEHKQTLKGHTGVGRKRCVQSRWTDPRECELGQHDSTVGHRRFTRRYICSARFCCREVVVVGTSHH